MIHQWTDEMDERIEGWRAEGVTCAEIARRLGRDFNKNMIIGRLHRLERMRKVVEVAPPKPPKPQIPIRRSKPLGQPAELLDLDPDGCKWGVAEDQSSLHRHIFCNAHRMKDRAYCRHHWLVSIGQARLRTG